MGKRKSNASSNQNKKLQKLEENVPNPNVVQSISKTRELIANPINVEKDEFESDLVTEVDQCKLLEKSKDGKTIIQEWKKNEYGGVS